MAMKIYYRALEYMDFVYNLFLDKPKHSPYCGGDKYNEMQMELKEILNTYKTYKYDDKTCNALEIMYNDKIVHLKPKELSEIITIGFKLNTTAKTKKDMCKIIINHLNVRYNLLVDVYNVVEECMVKLQKATNGNYCKNTTTFVTDFDTCKNSGGTWVTEQEFKQHAQTFKRNSNEYLRWKDMIAKLDKQINACLCILRLKYVKAIKEEILNPKGDDHFAKLKQETETLLKHIQVMTTKQYNAIVNF